MLNHRKVLVPQSLLARFFLLAALFCAHVSLAAINGSDNFNDNSKDVTKWGADLPYGNGVLTETSQRLQYTVGSPTLEDVDYSYRPWSLNQASYNSDWEVILDVHNGVTPTVVSQVTSMGIEVFNANNLEHSVYIELYASALDTLPLRRGFKTALSVTNEVAFSDTLNLGVTDGAIRLAFNSQTKVIRAFYDADGSANGYAWTQFGSFGIGNSGGTNGNAQWKMSGSQSFQVAIYGYNSNIAVTSGQMYADNFSALTAPDTAPALASVRTNSTILLSWPQSAVGYTPEATSSLTSPSWSAVTPLPVLSNGIYSVSQPLSESSRFFRLRKP